MIAYDTQFRIVVVEDEPFILKNIADKIERSGTGFQLAGCAYNGEEALELIDAVRPHVLLTDIQMPRMNGLELIRRVAGKYPDILIIVLSGFDEFEYAKEAMRCGAKDYLLKPLGAEEMRETLAGLREPLEAQRDARLRELLAAAIAHRPLPVDGGGVFGGETFHLLLVQIGHLGSAYYSPELSAFYAELWRRADVREAVAALPGTNRRWWTVDHPPYGQFVVLQTFGEERLDRLADCLLREIADRITPYAVTICAPAAPLALTQLGEAGNRLKERLEKGAVIGKSQVIYGGGEGEGRVAEGRVADSRGAEGRVAEGRAADGRGAEERAGGGRAAEERVAEGRAADGRGAEERAGGGRAAEERVSGGRLAPDRYAAMPDAQAQQKLGLLFQGGKQAALLDEVGGLIDRWAREGQSQRRVEKALLGMLQSFQAQTLLLSEEEKSHGQYELLNRIYTSAGYGGIKDAFLLLLENLLAANDEPDVDDTKDIANRVERYIKTNYMKPITLEEIAGQFHFTSSYLTKIYKKIKFTTPLKHVISLRMEEAKKLLETRPELSFKEIGAIVGYSDPNYFSRIFRNSTGQSLSEYSALFHEPPKGG